MRFGNPHLDEAGISSGEEGSYLLTGQSFLERMGVLYADRIRLNIVAELYMREMSPKQFFEQVGGSSYYSVRRHFMKLVEYGWLRKVRKAEVGGPGRPEMLYRSTELAVIDDETWGKIPISIRDSFSVQNILEMGERLQVSLTAGTMDSEKGDVVAFAPLLLDEPGWIQVIETLNRCFRSLSQEQTDAKIRLEQSGSPSILMIVELGGFESLSYVPGDLPTPLPAAPPGQGVPPWPRRISKIFSDPLNLEVIKRLNERPMSPTQLHEALSGFSVEGFDRRCKMLVKLGWIAKVDELTGGERRGATENFYLATSPASSLVELFNDVPEGFGSSESWQEFRQFCQSALVSIRAGTFNKRPDRHLTLCTLLVDETGRQQLALLLRNCLRSVRRIRLEAERRMKSGNTSVTKLGVGCFVAGFASPLNDMRSIA